MSAATDAVAMRREEGDPWPGLESFHEADAPFFRGRQAARGDLFRLVLRERLTVLYGVSGLGKSSLLQAGLFPLLREDRMLPVYLPLVHEPAAPPLREQVLAAVTAAADAAELEAPPFDSGRTLWENFHRGGARFWTSDHRPVTPVLVLDHFEAAFAAGRRTPELARATAAFLEELADLVEGRVPAAVRERLDADPSGAAGFAFAKHPYRVLIALREDFLADLEMLRPRMPSLVGNRMRLTPLSGTAALQVTAAGGEDLVPPEVGKKIVRLVAGERQEGLPLDQMVVEPPLLSLFLRELNERRKARGLASITPGLVTRDSGSILTRFYEESLQGLGAEVQTLVEGLATVAGLRNTKALADALAMEGVTPEALDTLVERRLIRREERAGQTWIELTHDVLAPVVKKSREQREAREKEEALRAAALAEQEALREQALKEQEALREQALKEQQVLTEKARAEQRKAQRLMLGLGFFVLTAIVVAGLWYRADRSERLAQASRREAVLQAELNLEVLRLEHEQALRQTAADSAIGVLGSGAPCAPGESAEACYARALVLAADSTRGLPREARRELHRRALPLMRAACERGHAPACFGAGIELRILNPEDTVARRLSADLFERGCDARPGSGSACNALGEAYAYRLGRPFDEKRATEAFERGCELDHATACFRAARRVKEEAGSDPADLVRARRMAEQSCRLGSPTGCIDRATSLQFSLSGADTIAYGPVRYRAHADALIRTFTEACDSSFYIACTNLAAMRQGGDLYTQADTIAARRIYERACNGGAQRPERGAGVACAYLAKLKRKQGAPDSVVIDLYRRGCRLPAPDACIMLAKDSTSDGRPTVPPAEAAILAGTACFHNQWFAEGCHVAAVLSAPLNPDAARRFYRRGCDLGYQDSCAAERRQDPAVTRR
ncbi:MAG TPA: hypothetical protein VHG93_22795 [Longimicrobium sp.]|nr:hypothetical protein [Longimicrobium sp.]